MKRYLDVSTLHTIKIDATPTIPSSTISTTIEDISTRCAFQDSAGYPRILDVIDRGLFEVGTPTRPLKVGPARLVAAMLGDLGVSTLRSIQDHDSVFFSFLEHQTSHAACFNARGLLYECVFNTLLFSSSYRLVGKLISHHVVTRHTFFLFFFLGPSYRPSCPPQCSDTTHECISDAL
jgi:hypothetical protein